MRKTIKIRGKKLATKQCSHIPFGAISPNKVVETETEKFTYSICYPQYTSTDLNQSPLLATCHRKTNFCLIRKQKYYMITLSPDKCTLLLLKCKTFLYVNCFTYCSCRFNFLRDDSMPLQEITTSCHDGTV